MTIRAVRPALSDILDTIERIEAAIEGKSFDEFSADWVLRAAVQRGIEIISEASRRIPDEMKARRPEIPWPSVAAIGNILRHEYHTIADKVIWDAVVHDLPALAVAVRALRDSTDDTS